MKRARQLAVFSAEFLELLDLREPAPLSAYEAALAGPWRVERQGEEYAVIREGEGEPEAVLRFRDTALLVAARSCSRPLPSRPSARPSSFSPGV